MSPSSVKWLLLLHQVPPTPGYLRAKILRRLNLLGAVAIKKSAYVLPATDETLEDFEWVLREIRDGGGEAWLFRSDVCSGLTDEGLEGAFRTQACARYAELGEGARKLLEELRGRQTQTASDAGEPAAPAARASHLQDWQRLKRRHATARRSDFFGAEGATEVETLMTEIERSLQGEHKTVGRERGGDGLTDLRARTWVTRRGVKIDRIASAWLIRRFIDPAARFAFVDPATYAPAPDEVRFDMFEGEFTHQGNQCTFEVLRERCGARDAGLRALAEIVHDIDLKDDLYDRPEALGVALGIDGIVLRHADDERRIEEGAMLFDALLAKLGEAAS